MQRPHDAACSEHVRLSRRRLLQGGAASLALWAAMPRTAVAGARDPRLLTMVLRGGLDGLSLAAPVGDPDYVRLRQGIALAAPGADMGGLPLDPMFALNPNMPFLHALFERKQALIAHAVHTPYRDRSHFDGQDILESGLPAIARAADSGWMNRALARLPAAGKASPRGLAMGPIVPLVMRGQAPVLSWIPKLYNRPLRDSTVERLLDLYAHTDPALARALAEGLEINRVAETGAAMQAAARGGTGAQPAAAQSQSPMGRPMVDQMPNQSNPQIFREFTEAAEAAALFLGSADGPRIGALSYNGWDTHANEGVIQGTLGNRLAGLDAAIKVLHAGLGEVWKETVIVVVTEFGRTARVNGTAGTDHGMATCALLVGGAVNGGRVVADWPGLRDADLFEARDLKPTADLRAFFKGVLRDHIGVPVGALADAVFPGSGAVKGLDGLIA